MNPNFSIDLVPSAFLTKFVVRISRDFEQEILNFVINLTHKTTSPFRLKIPV